MGGIAVNEVTSSPLEPVAVWLTGMPELQHHATLLSLGIKQLVDKHNVQAQR